MSEEAPKRAPKKAPTPVRLSYSEQRSAHNILSQWLIANANLDGPRMADTKKMLDELLNKGMGR